MSIRRSRIVSLCAAALTLSGGLVALAPPAVADGPHFHSGDEVQSPDTNWYANAWNTGDYAPGDLVYAFSTKPLTDRPGDGAGLPEGVTRITGDKADPSDTCVAIDGYTEVYRCRVKQSLYPTGVEFHVAADAPDTTTYFGYAFVPQGGDLAEGIRTAQTGGVRPPFTSGMGSMTVKTLAHAESNTVEYDTPDLASGGSARHRLRLHMADAGVLRVDIFNGDAQPWRTFEQTFKAEDLVTSPGVDCGDGLGNATPKVVICQVSPGEQTIEYTVRAAAGLEAWRFVTAAHYNIYDAESPAVQERFTTRQGFAMSGAPLRTLHNLLVRDSAGKLYGYAGTGRAAAPFRYRDTAGSGWQAYNAVTKLSPFTEDLFYRFGAPTAAELKGHGDSVARDAAGHLWYYARKFDGWPYKQRTSVGGGWQVYNTLTGAGDVDGDRNMDLLARDKSGILWLYKGTGTPAAPFTARTRVGGGWNTYTQLTGSADLNGDGTPDLLARDKTGVLWLYKGTGTPSAPFTARTRVGGGWNTYTTLSVTGDLTQDRKSDLVARDASGVLWLYKGTGTSTAPFTPRTRIGGGWNAYKDIF